MEVLAGLARLDRECYGRLGIEGGRSSRSLCGGGDTRSVYPSGDTSAVRNESAGKAMSVGSRIAYCVDGAQRQRRERNRRHGATQRTSRYVSVPKVSLYWPGARMCAVPMSVMHRPSLSVSPEPRSVHEPLASRFDIVTTMPEAGRPREMSSTCVVTGGFVRGAGAVGLSCRSTCIHRRRT